MKAPNANDELHCSIKELPHLERAAAAKTAIRVCPQNRPPVELGDLHPDFLVALTTKYWGAGGVELTVGFLSSVTPEVRERLLSHMNAWGEWCNARFRWTQQSAQVRISFGSGGYWSFLGVDILHIPAGQATMNLQGFGSASNPPPESEWKRVVRHETGHTLGFPHEHMRPELVERLDRAKTIAWGKSVLGWSEQMVVQQILTPISEGSMLHPEWSGADEDSIMCYVLPSSITKDGLPIRGGVDIDPSDRTYAGKIYPKATPPPGNVIVPSVMGFSRPAAVAELQAVGLTSSITFQTVNAGLDNVVLAQSPTAGTAAPAGSSVALVVSKLEIAPPPGNDRIIRLPPGTKIVVDGVEV